MKLNHFFLGFGIFLSSILSLEASQKLEDSDSDGETVVTHTVSPSAHVGSSSVPQLVLSSDQTNSSFSSDAGPRRHPLQLPVRGAQADQLVIPILDDQSALLPPQGGPVLPVAIVGGHPIMPVDPVAEHRRQEEARWVTGETFYYYLGAVNNNLGVFCGGAATFTSAIAAGISDPVTKQYLILTSTGFGAAGIMFLYFGSKAGVAEKDRHDKVEAAFAQDRV